MFISLTKNSLQFFLASSLYAIKFYRLLCYTTYTFDIFPIVNPYNWPLSFINALTRPYFRLLKKIFKPVYLGEYGRFDISSILSFLVLEAIYRELVLLYILVKSI